MHSSACTSWNYEMGLHRSFDAVRESCVARRRKKTLDARPDARCKVLHFPWTCEPSTYRDENSSGRDGFLQIGRQGVLESCSGVSVYYVGARWLPSDDREQTARLSCRKRTLVQLENENWA